MDFSKLFDILFNLFDKLTVLNSLLLLLLIFSWVGFYFALKILWKTLQESQEQRIKDEKELIKVQESTTTALNSLTKVVEVAFGASRERR